jgi:signal transduction histidine kinase
VFGWRRLRVALGVALAVGLLLSPGWTRPIAVISRAALLGLFALLVFGVFEQWPRELPRRVGRWVLQVVAVGLSVPIGTLAMYLLTTPGGAPPFWQVPERLEGFMNLTLLGLFLAPWIALGALVRQRESFARNQALAFALERSELERQALDARMHLLQAQVAPHFLFNTLANVRELVDVGSPRASTVLDSLIAYLRAAVPRLAEPATTLGQELDLVRAYLEVMHMRMPDRLQFALAAGDAARAVYCPPMAVLTLVENAVRHGIDPSEDGGRIDLRVELRDGRCACEVTDTGVGLGVGAGAATAVDGGSTSGGGGGSGTGLAMLRERLALAFGGEATLRIEPLAPRGVRASLIFPARSAA